MRFLHNESIYFRQAPETIQVLYAKRWNELQWVAANGLKGPFWRKDWIGLLLQDGTFDYAGFVSFRCFDA